MLADDFDLGEQRGKVGRGGLKQLDDWRRKQPDLPSWPEALRRLAEKELGKDWTRHENSHE